MSHEGAPCRHCGYVYIKIIRSFCRILGTMEYPKIFLFETVTSKLSESGSGIILSTLDEFECSFENASFSMVFKLFGLKLAFICKK